MARHSRSCKPASVLLCGVLLAGSGWIGHRSAEPAEAQQPPSQDPYPNWPIPPTTLEAWMVLEKERKAAERVEMRVAKDAGAGMTGALDVTFYLPDEGVELRTKWKTAPDGLDGMNNSPRHELAAYAVQKLFLDPEDFVVPTSAFRCLPLEVMRPHKPDAVATIDGTRCELGLFSVWLKNVTVPDRLYDEARFVSDRQYAYYMANFNLLTYLIAHKDGRDGNFLVSMNDTRRQVFAVDNGIAFDIAFGGLWFNWFVPNWHEIRVPAFRKESIDRLRKVRPEDLDSLGVLTQLEGDEQGILQPVRPTANLDPSKGARVHGMTIQLGLKRSEIDDVYDRIQRVIHAVDEGTTGVF